MKTTIKSKSTLALTGVLAIGCASATLATAEEPSPDATCHGQAATIIGTGGNDVISDETTDLGRNPVIVLGEGADELRVGLSYASLDSLTVCAGPGDDAVEVYDGVGGRADMLLDGGTDDDFVGYNGDSFYSNVASMSVIGGDGDDELRGGNDDDRLNAGRGDDRVYGVGGIDRIVGGEGDDSLYGERGSDTLLGGRGFDLLVGDKAGFPDGTDRANGGANRDRCEAEIKKDCER